MIAMQYKIVLPSDYPMALIEDRIEKNGHLLNGYPGLLFKAFLYSRKDADNYANPVNSYAPFYIWEDHLSMSTFLNSDGFKALCDHFGQPNIEIWFVEGEAIKPNSDDCFAVIQKGSKLDSDITAFNYTAWEPLSVNWASEGNKVVCAEQEVYAIGYVAQKAS
ncbi:DUF4865 family protein [Psychromonas sp. KJ10-2]|uniref:DUF4865 family protein n=1 Tax=Psychromonas sp. KJ10-2 TaxID=3391822 RepID=UPI0039B60711